MKHTLSDLGTIFGARKGAPAPQHGAKPATDREVVMRVTLDAQHATPLRRALIRDCAGQPWTIRVTPLHGTNRVRLVLFLPKTALKSAMQRVTDLAPKAEIAQLVVVPQAPTDAWRKLMHPGTSHAFSPLGAHGPREDGSRDKDTIAHRLIAEHVLLGVDAADRASLFAQLGELLAHRYGLAASSVVAGLAAREALGSTALGQGVAVPHGQIKGLREALVLYVRPVVPIPFDAPDGKPVSDMVVLLVPEWANMTHLHLLAEVAERFCDQRFREQLHACEDPDAVCRLFADFEARDIAERAS